VAVSGEPGSATASIIRRRAVFYLSGFDPRGPGFYHALYREQAEAQGRLTGARLEVGPMERADRLLTTWRVTDAGGTRTDYGFLRWDDLIREHWHRSDWHLLADSLAVYARMTVAGVFRRIRRVSLPFWFTLTYPLATALAVLAAPIAPAAAVAWALRATPWWAALAAAAVALVILVAARRLAVLLKADWILRIVIFTWRQAHGRVAGLDERLDAFAGILRRAWDDPELDEVVLIGHSVGTELAVAVTARAASGAPPRAARGLLTIGQTFPLLGAIAAAERFRSELAAVAADERLRWVDVSAPPDGACVALTDPLASCGMPASGRVQLVAARFHRQFQPARYRRIRRNRFRIHFQYLMAAEIAEGFDYYRTTGSDRPFAESAAAGSERP
jgi:hypothetical protein